eukprot:scaffold649585_cov33-Prasinocladus_malaysianus.AAC.1
MEEGPALHRHRSKNICCRLPGDDSEERAVDVEGGFATCVVQACHDVVPISVMEGRPASKA